MKEQDMAKGVVRQQGRRVDPPDDVKQRIISLYQSEGKSYTEISRETGYSRWAVGNVLQDAGVNPGSNRNKNKVKTENGKVVSSEASGSNESGGVVTENGRRTTGQSAERRSSVISEETNAKSAYELAESIRETADEARESYEEVARLAEDYKNKVNQFLASVDEVWNRAEAIVQVERALDDALQTMRELNRRNESYQRKLSEYEQKNRERALAIHSESTRYG